LDFNLVSNDHVDDAVTQAIRAGGSLLRRETYELGGIVEHHAYVTDPDGYVLELNAQQVQLSRKRQS